MTCFFVYLRYFKKKGNPEPRRNFTQINLINMGYQVDFLDLHKVDQYVDELKNKFSVTSLLFRPSSSKTKKDTKDRKKVKNLRYTVDCGDGKSGILCMDTLTVFCYCNEENADLILNAIIKAYKM
jgi:hypothetical protein